MRWQSVLAHGMVVSMLAGCGGGARDFGEVAATPAGAAATPAPAPVATTPAGTLELASNVPNVGSDGQSIVTITATMKDANNVALQGQPVSFGTSDPGVLIQVRQGSTDASGRATADISITERSNRIVTVRATSGSAATTTAFEVTGTAIQVAGPTTAQLNESLAFTAVIRDASGIPLGNTAVAATSAKATLVSLSAPVTDAQGRVVARTVAPSGGDTITFSAAGAQATARYTVAAASIAVLAPAAGADAEINQPVSLQLRYQRDGVPVPGVPLALTTTRGAFANAAAVGSSSDGTVRDATATTVVTGADGIAVASLGSSQTGSALITAVAPDGTQGQGRFEFISSAAAKVELQPAPSVVGVNLGNPSVRNGSTLTAVVRDAADNPVKGARVTFTAVSDPSGGSFSSAFAFTDGAGLATSTFFPGPNVTGLSQIVLQAAVRDVNGQVVTADTAELTASRQELQVRIGTGNIVLTPPPPDDAVYNDLPYGVVVTDSAGNPVKNVNVQASVVATAYIKGTWLGPLNQNQSGPVWSLQPAAVCPSEDILIPNLRLDPGEDLNGDRVLTPGNVATVFFPGAANPGVGVTSETGTVSMRIRYPRDRSAWTQVRLRVTAAMTGGTEGAAETTFILPNRASDLTDRNVPPPGYPSPYGQLSPCSARE